MENTNWLRQSVDKPLFPDLLWSRPENKNARGKLLIIGGNTFSLAAPASAYSAAMRAGAGTVRVIMPDSLRKVVSKMFPEAEFAPSTPSGGFSRKALAEVLEGTNWADGVLMAGDLGGNSETAILLESVAEKYSGQLTVAQDGIDYFLQPKSPLLERENTVLVINLGKLQKLAKNTRPSTPVLHSMSLLDLISLLADWTNGSPIAFITRHLDNFIVAYAGKVTITPSKEDTNWQVDLAAYAAVWHLQFSDKPFESLSTAIHNYKER